MRAATSSARTSEASWASDTSGKVVTSLVLAIPSTTTGARSIGPTSWKVSGRCSSARRRAGRGRDNPSPANVREAEPYGTGRFKNRQATPQQESAVNDPRHHTLRVRVPGMTTVAGDFPGTPSGSLPRGAQFNGTYIEPQTAVSGVPSWGEITSGPRALGPGPRPTPTGEVGSGKRKGQQFWEF